MSDRRWEAVQAEHAAAVRDFVESLRRVPASGWQHAARERAWTPAGVALHVIRSYEVGCRGAAGDGGMRLMVPPARARVARTLFLPIILATGRFPPARAPRETVPEVGEAAALGQEEAIARLVRTADEAASALRRADAPGSRVLVTHAYFGPLEPRRVLRLLSVHTRHHARGLA
ncbi:MAG TPA: DinB family protein [Gemmatimonadales bacterium]|nr:DinB family protein [Gemmatimonadales bacterium]